MTRISFFSLSMSAVLRSLLACTLFVSVAHAEDPIPKYYGAGNTSPYGPPQIFDSVESACTELAALGPNLAAMYPPPHVFLGIFIKTNSSGSYVEGVLPYNTPGVSGWVCYAKYRLVFSTYTTETTSDYASALPVCAPSFVGGTYPISTGADTCPNNPQHFVYAQPKEKGCCDGPTPSMMVKDPINVASGNMYKTERDVEPSSASAPSFTRFYNSLDKNAADLGVGWRHSFTRRVEIVHNVASVEVYDASDANNSSLSQTAADACLNGFAQIQSKVSNWTGASVTYANDVCTINKGGVPFGRLPIGFAYPRLPPPRSAVLGYNVVRDDGRTIWFGSIGGVLTAAPGITLRLQQTAGGFTVTDNNDSVETYDANGTLLSITHRSGLSQTLTYTGGNLTSVTDNFGHGLSLSYDASNRLGGVTEGGQATTYAYDPEGRLSLVTHADTTTRSYLYENASFPNALTGLIDEQGVRLSTWVYDAQGRATSTFEAGGADAGSLAYNADGTVTMTDTLGAVRTFTFSRVGDRNLTSGISGSQCPTCGEGKATTYNDYGWVISRTDYNNNVTQYANDNARGLEISRTEAFGTPRARTITTAWHSLYRLPMQIDDPGKRTTLAYDASGNLLSRTETDTATSTSRTWTFSYSSLGQVLTVDGPRTDVSDVTNFSYYACNTGYECGQVATITNALGQVVTFNAYNAHGQPLTITDANGVVTTLAYDSRQRLTSRTVNGEVTAFEYWPAGLLKKATLPDGSFIAYSYDAAHRLTGLADADGNRIAYTLDAMGNRTKEEFFDPSNALAQTRSRVFNQLSQLSQDIGAAGTPSVTTTIGYDANGNQTAINAPLARNSSNGYDELNRLTSDTDPMSGITSYGYNALDQLISVTDPRSLQTTYAYNALGDLKQQVSPDTGTTTNTFDSAGNLKTSKDARNKTATYTYDALNRVAQVAFGDQTVGYGYDAGANAVGRLTSSSDANHSQSWSYDAQGRVLSKTQTVGTVTKTQSYAYTNGQLTSVTTPYGAVIGYNYTNGKITGITVNGASVLTNVLYEPFGPTSGWTWGNGTFAVRTYDTDGKVTQIDSAGLKTYQYDDAFRITGITDTVTPANSWSYGYDNEDRLASASSTSIAQGFAFDADGNRLTQTGTTNTTFTYPATSNRLSTATGSLAKTYIYDAAGNITSDGTIVYTYYNSGRMKTAKNGSASAVTYTYNALGQRIKKTGTTRYFVYDEAEHLQGEYNSSGTMVQEFVWLGDTPVAVFTPKTGGVNIFYIHTDHLNTPRKITRPSDNKLRWTWSPDPYGKGAPNENPQALGVFTFNLRFPGQYFDSETGNHYNYFRDYDPSTGRYLKSDPIGLEGGLNTYAYVNANPVGHADPKGLIYDSVTWACLRDPAFCLEIMGQMVQNLGGVNANLTGNACLRDEANDLAEGFSTAATVVTVVTVAAGATALAKMAVNKFAALGLPKLEISASKYPELAQNISHAQRAGHPNVLTHGSDAAANRAAALDGVPNIRGLSRDEYPFASSMEGGGGSWVGHIPVSQQQAQGGLITQIIRQNGLGVGDQYKVVIVP